ncbi:hypothetical protein NBRC116592_01970 [Colwellia sp. KU-HH00111]|uniref:ATP-binding protein n=1 Tax=Colwellia sp. KU-HH00111 TaxID=3127652 RepID=UPI003107B6CF
MLLKSAENTVFRRYNTAVVVTFFIIFFVALAAASLRYYSELATHKQQGLQQLTAQALQLNTMLVQSEQAITGIQEFAEYMLKYPDELNAQLPVLRQDNSLFFLDKPTRASPEQHRRISGNITGFGNIEQFSLLKKQEIVMANMLTPAFVTAKKVLDEANWFYYVSRDKFVSIFPWIGRDSWRFSDRMLTNVHAKEIQKLGVDNNKVIWSAPYIDAAGTGMNTSLGMGVYRDRKMLGAVVIDISLARLQDSLPTLTHEDQGLVLFNQNNDILIFKQKGKEPLRYRASWQQLLPEGLHHLTQEALSKQPNLIHIGDWLVEKQTLPINGWTLLKYQPYSQYILPLRNHFVFMFTILLIGLLAFLMLVNSMTKRSFIKPTHNFISHIEYCAQGDPGKVKATEDWLHWFELVEDIFTQNRSLLLQLKEQNEVLDSRVLEKTQALADTSAKHQRDYVLLRSVMNAIPDLIIFNDPDGKLMGCNQAFEQLCGHLENEMLGFQASEFMPSALAKAIHASNIAFDNNYPQHELLKAGDKSYQGYCNQFANAQGEMLGTISILQDVTERQATQSALVKAKNQAEYANQVKIQFLANMSHEIRTPINAMQGMMDLLTRTSLDSRQQHYLQNAQTAAYSLLHLVDELLDLSKVEAGKLVIIKDVIDIPATIDKAIKLNTSSLYAKQLSLKIALSPSVPHVLMSDEMRLVQVLSNLLNNAIKFTEQGEISLLIDTIDLNETTALIRFIVSDTGIGIATDKQGQLFEAFTQADISMTRKYGGSGLGLSICQQIVKLLGGEITLKSELGGGCEFSFVIPFPVPDKKVVQQLTLINAVNNQLGTVHLVVVNQSLSVSCIETISSLAWHYHPVTNLPEFYQQFSAQIKRNTKIVLLLDEAEFLQQKTSLENAKDNCNQWIDLIALCQPTMRELSSESCQLLDKMGLDYILLDTPLYRYSLDQVARALASKSQTSITLEADISTNKHNPLALPNMDTTEGKTDLSEISILLVEDNLVNQLVAKELLLSMNASVTIAENGQLALDALKEQVFDIVLMDIQMPVMDGLTAAAEIKKQPQYHTLPIIAMTAHAREEDVQRSLAAGMNLHISKPVTAKVLLASILQALELEQ